MKFSKKSRYGIRALIDLSVYSANEHIVLGSIAERNGISPQYLEQIFASLRRAGIVKGIKGSQGGYKLNREPKEIMVSEIIEALEGSYKIEPEDAADDAHARSISESIQELVIDKVNEGVGSLLQNITLEDLREKYFDKKDSGQDMYYI